MEALGIQKKKVKQYLNKIMALVNLKVENAEKRYIERCKLYNT